MATLNKKELLDRVESSCEYSREEIEEVLNLLMSEIGSGLGRGDNVSLAGYGIFVPRVQKRTQEGKSGSTGWWRAGDDQPGRTTVIYKPGKDMLGLINHRSTTRREDK